MVPGLQTFMAASFPLPVVLSGSLGSSLGASQLLAWRGVNKIYLGGGDLSKLFSPTLPNLILFRDHHPSLCYEKFPKQD